MDLYPPEGAVPLCPAFKLFFSSSLLLHIQMHQVTLMSHVWHHTCSASHLYQPLAAVEAVGGFRSPPAHSDSCTESHCWLQVSSGLTQWRQSLCIPKMH